MARILVAKEGQVRCTLPTRALVTDKTAWDNTAARDHKHLVETNPRREELVRRARKAAQRAAHEPDPESQMQWKRDSRRYMWIGFAAIVGVLLFLKLLSS